MAWSRLDKIETNIVNMSGYSCIVSTMYLIDFLLVIQTNGTHKFPPPPNNQQCVAIRAIRALESVLFIISLYRVFLSRSMDL